LVVFTSFTSHLKTQLPAAAAVPAQMLVEEIEDRFVGANLVGLFGEAV